jgi:biotin transport system substrate-specific component
MTALFAALTAAGAFIAVPLGPSVIVLQNMLALLAGLVLGPVLGGAAVLLYLLAGTIGLPVFAGGAGGFAVLGGPTGGFLIGYFLAAVLGGLIAGAPKAGVRTPIARIIIAAVCGMLIVYLPGLIWMRRVTAMTWPKTFLAGCLPFLPGDAIKAALACLITGRLRRVAGQILGR